MNALFAVFLMYKQQLDRHRVLPVVVWSDELPGPQLTEGAVVSLIAQYEGKSSTRPPGIVEVGTSTRIHWQSGLRSSKLHSNENMIF